MNNNYFIVVENAFLCCKYRIKIQETGELPSYYNIKKEDSFCPTNQNVLSLHHLFINDLQYVYRIILYSALQGGRYYAC